MFVTKSSNAGGINLRNQRGSNQKIQFRSIIKKTAHNKNFVQCPFITHELQIEPASRTRLALIPLLGFGVENKKNSALRIKPKNRSRKMQMRRSIQLPFATVQRMHSLAAEDLMEIWRTVQMNNPTNRSNPCDSPRTDLIIVESLERRSNVRPLYG